MSEWDRHKRSATNTAPVEARGAVQSPPAHSTSRTAARLNGTDATIRVTPPIAEPSNTRQSPPPAPAINSSGANRKEAATPSKGTTATEPAASETATAETTVPDTWSDDETSAAQRTCDELLANVSAETDRIPAIRKGICGAPVSLRLNRIGSASGVAIKPAATTNCAMVAHLYQWLETIAQPAARETLGSPIVAIRNASSYMCRNRYNDPAQKISEHAFANALDLSTFELADGRTIDVKSYWGAVVESRNAADAVVQISDQQRLTPRAVTAGLSTERGDLKHKPSATGSAAEVKTPELTFLKKLHGGACGIFSTVLGPEANRAHHDHFHFDLKSRRASAYCE